LAIEARDGDINDILGKRPLEALKDYLDDLEARIQVCSLIAGEVSHAQHAKAVIHSNSTAEEMIDHLKATTQLSACQLQERMRDQGVSDKLVERAASFGKRFNMATKFFADISAQLTAAAAVEMAEMRVAIPIVSEPVPPASSEIVATSVAAAEPVAESRDSPSVLVTRTSSVDAVLSEFSSPLNLGDDQ